MSGQSGMFERVATLVAGWFGGQERGSSSQPKRFGEYQVLEELKSLASDVTTVYRVRRDGTDEETALLLLRASDTAACHRFVKQQAMLERVRHPNIPGYRMVGHVEGVPFIELSSMIGPSLQDLLEHKSGLPPLTLRDWISCLICACHAAQVLHEHGVVHRAIAPKNIVLHGFDPTSEHPLVDARPVLMNLMDAEIVHASQMTWASDLPLGAAGYQSPQQVQGLAPDVHDDIFSIGAILYRVATGTLVCGARSDDEIQTRLRSAWVEPVPVWLKTAHPVLAEVIAMATRPDARNRFRSVGVLKNALDRAYAATPASMTPHDLRQRSAVHNLLS